MIIFVVVNVVTISIILIYYVLLISYILLIYLQLMFSRQKYVVMFKNRLSNVDLINIWNHVKAVWHKS